MILTTLLTTIFIVTIPSIRGSATLVQSIEKKGSDISLILGQQDHQDLLISVLNHCQREGAEADSCCSIVTAQPGPLALDSGLRLLPNEMVPKAEVPRILLISAMGELHWNTALLAFVRHCLMSGAKVYVVGPEIPKALAEFELPQQTVINRINVNDVDGVLAK